MQLHANAKLGPAGRLALCRAIDDGMTLRAAAAAFGVSPATAHRWWHRFRVASAQEQLSFICVRDRSSRPRCSPRRLTAAEEEPILRARRETNLGPGRLAGIVRRARSTIWKVLRRHGVSRRPRGERQTFRRYEWSRAGALLHVDMAELPRFRRPGHAVTGDRSKTGYQTRHGLGLVYLHCVVDDHSRYAYVEQHQVRDAAITAAGARTRDCSLRRARPRPARGGDDRQRLRLHEVTRVRGRTTSQRHPPHRDPSLHAPLERQGRALHPHTQGRMGKCPRLAHLSRPFSSTGILHPLLQPPPTTHLTRRPATDQPRSQPAWAGQLGARPPTRAGGAPRAPPPAAS
jgi:transposase